MTTLRIANLQGTRQGNSERHQRGMDMRTLVSYALLVSEDFDNSESKSYKEAIESKDK